MSIVEQLTQPDLAKYRRLVIKLADGGSDEIPNWEVLEALGKSSTDFVDDRNRRRTRRAAVLDLKRAAKLEKKAAAIVIPPLEERGTIPLASIGTVGQLFGLLEAIRLGAQSPAAEKRERNDLRSEASAIRGEALRALGNTCDPVRREKLHDNRQFISDRQHFIDGNLPVIELGTLVEHFQACLDGLVRGKPDLADVGHSPREMRRLLEAELGKCPRDALRRAKEATRANAKAE